jgi:hypothetical protein
MTMKLALAATLLMTAAYAQDGKGKKDSGCSGCGESCASCQDGSMNLVLPLKEIPNDRREEILESFQRRFGAGATLDGTRVLAKIEPKGRVLLSDILDAAEECKVTLVESGLSLKCTTVWFEEKTEALEANYPEYAFAAATDGTTCLTFGPQTSMTLADARKIGKIKQAETCPTLPKTGGGCGGCGPK